MLHYGLRVREAGWNSDGVAVAQGDTPFPDGALYPVPVACLHTPAYALAVEDECIVLATEDEQRFRALPLKYKKQVDGIWVEMTSEEKAAVDADAETARQAAKSLVVKTAENNFLLLCETLFGSKAKAGFAEINAALVTLMGSDPQTATVLSLRLLGIDAEMKREAGLRWWDDCAWHQEIVT